MKSFSKVNALISGLGLGLGLGLVVFGHVFFVSMPTFAQEVVQEQGQSDAVEQQSASDERIPLLQALIESGELEGKEEFLSQLKKFEDSNVWLRQFILRKLLKEISQEELEELELKFYRSLNIYANEGEPGTSIEYYLGFQDRLGNLKLRPIVFNSKAVEVPSSRLRIQPVLVVQNSPYLFSVVAPTGIARTAIAPMTVFHRKITENKAGQTIVFPVYGGAITMNYDAFRLLRKSDRLKENTVNWLLAFTKLNLVLRPNSPVHNPAQLKLLEDLF